MKCLKLFATPHTYKTWRKKTIQEQALVGGHLSLFFVLHGRKWHLYACFNIYTYPKSGSDTDLEQGCASCDSSQVYGIANEISNSSPSGGTVTLNRRCFY
jgi:hypothetical protein